MKKTFIGELTALINQHSMENASNTPDWVLAQYLCGCLDTWNRSTQQRENWYGRDPRPAGEEVIPSITGPAPAQS